MKHRNAMTRTFFLSLPLLLLLGIGPRDASGDPRPTNAAIGPNTVEIVSYGSGYGRQFPSGPAFQRGRAPFGAGGGGAGGGVDCDQRQTVRKEWPVGSVLIIRRFVVIPPGATNIRIMVSVDNDILEARFDGMPLVEHTSVSGNTTPPDTIIHDGCPIPDEFRFDVPDVMPGVHGVDLQVRDRGVESFLDVRILADIVPPGTAGTVTSLSGSAIGIGVGQNRAAVRIVGRFETDPAFSFAGAKAVATLSSAIFDGFIDVSPLSADPIQLSPDPSNTSSSFIYRSPAGTRPIVRLLVRRTGPGVYTYRLEVSQGTYVVPPIGCLIPDEKDLPPSEAALQTSFDLLDPSGNFIVVVTTQNWTCFGSENRYLTR
jgi:hypothetical protein